MCCPIPPNLMCFWWITQLDRQCLEQGSTCSCCRSRSGSFLDCFSGEFNRCCHGDGVFRGEEEKKDWGSGAGRRFLFIRVAVLALDLPVYCVTFLGRTGVMGLAGPRVAGRLTARAARLFDGRLTDRARSRAHTAHVRFRIRQIEAAYA